MSRTGKPYNVIIINIHKLLSILSIISVMATVYKLQEMTIINNPEKILIAGTVLFFLTAIISGGIMGSGKTDKKAIFVIHRFTTFLIIISFGLLIYLSQY